MYRDLYGIISIVIVIIAFIFYLLVKKKEGKDWVSAIYFAIVLIVGTFLYYFAIDYNSDSNIVFPRFFLIISSISLSIPSFIGNFNVQSHLSELAKESQIFQIAVMVHFLAAVILSSLMVIKFFSKKLGNEIKIWFLSFFNKYIVIGCDGQAEIFLKNLSHKQRHNTIVILQVLQAYKKLNLISKGYAVIIVKVEKKSEADNNFQYNAFRDVLKKAGAMKCRYKTRIVSMSEKDEINLLIAKILADLY